MVNQNNRAAFFAGSIIGSIAGATLVLLFTPQTGQETRTQIKDKSLKFKNRATEAVSETGHRAQEQVAIWEEKGKGALEKSKHSMAEAVVHSADNVIDAMNRGKAKIVQSMSHKENNKAEPVAS
jgi:gas vesicle protein